MIDILIEFLVLVNDVFDYYPVAERMFGSDIYIQVLISFATKSSARNEYVIYRGWHRMISQFRCSLKHQRTRGGDLYYEMLKCLRLTSALSVLTLVVALGLPRLYLT